MNSQLKSSWRPNPPVLARQDCPLCQGTGWQLILVGGLSRARRCACGALDRLLKLREGVRIPQCLQRCTLDNFRPVTLSQTRALTEARRFVERYPTGSRDLLFSGPPGVGKTHLAVGIVRELLQGFHDDILFTDFESVFRLHRASERRTLKSDPEWNRLQSVDLLVLDNFGLIPPSSPEALWMTETVLNARWNSKKRTLFTGDPVDWRAVFCSGARLPAHSSRTQNLLFSFPSQTLVHLMSEVRVLTIHGLDFREQIPWNTSLFDD